MQDLGINIINSCYGKSTLEKNLKNISQGNDFIFNNLRKIKRLLKKNKNSKIISKTQIELQQKEFTNYDKLPIPFVKGLINDDNYINFHIDNNINLLLNYSFGEDNDDVDIKNINFSKIKSFC